MEGCAGGRPGGGSFRTLEDYLELLKATYPAIKRGDPQVIVLPSAMCDEAVQQAGRPGTQRLFWLLLRDRQEPYFGSIGLAEAQGDPRPAWSAFQRHAQGDRGR